jgi:hypothetical protein
MKRNYHNPSSGKEDSVTFDNNNDDDPPGGAGGVGAGISEEPERQPVVPGEWHPLRAIFSPV